jgi:hypothetical protein
MAVVTGVIATLIHLAGGEVQVGTLAKAEKALMLAVLTLPGVAELRGVVEDMPLQVAVASGYLAKV